MGVEGRKDDSGCSSLGTTVEVRSPLIQRVWLPTCGLGRTIPQCSEEKKAYSSTDLEKWNVKRIDESAVRRGGMDGCSAVREMFSTAQQRVPTAFSWKSFSSE